MYPIHLQQLRPQTTAHLAQTMTLLSMTAAELQQTIEAELAANPALELAPIRSCRTCGRRLIDPGPCPLCSRPQDPNDLEPIVFTTARRDYHTTGSNLDTAHAAEDLPDDNLAPQIDLAGYVLRQIAPDLAEEDRPIAAHILTSLDDDGLLPIPLLEICRYHHASPDRVRAVLRLIQFAEPIGVGSSDTRQALLIQLEALGRQDETARLAERAIREGMELLSQRHFSKLGELLGVTSARAEEIAEFIHHNLNPFPARAHWGGVRHGSEALPAVYHSPDILIHTLNGQPGGSLVVELLFPLRGMPRLHPLFRQEMRKAPATQLEKWQQDYEKASLLIKCLRQRENTLQGLMTILAKEQREFILKGDRYLKSMTRASLAERLGVHESTVSRAVSGKTAQLPNGRIVPLSKFFDRSLAIRTEIRDLIAREKEPLSDAKIAAILRKNGHNIARRTVAKYRAMEGILPARTRQKLAASANR